MATSIGSPPLLRTAVFGAVAALLLAGCAPGDPLDGKVVARDGLSFAMWQSSMATRLNPSQVETMDKALQEIKFHIMSVDGISGHDAVDAALFEKIDGQPLHLVLHIGLSWELERAQAEWRALNEALIRNGAYADQAHGNLSLDYRRLHQQQVDHLHAVADEMALTRSRLQATSGQLAGP